MSHCRLGPTACSQCASAPAHVVTVTNGTAYVDGVPVRPAQPGIIVTERMRRSMRKGGAR